MTVLDAAGKEVEQGSVVEVLMTRKAVVTGIEYTDQQEAIVKLKWMDAKPTEVKVLWHPAKARLLYG